MSEELFDKNNANQIRQNGLIMTTDEVVDLLNSQSKLISAYQYEFVKMRKENEQLRKEKEYYREYALKYLTEYELFSDNFLNTIKDIIIDEEEFKRVKEEQDNVIKALKKEGLYE